MLYFYTEGMMAPMGTFDNYKRIPRGLLVLDRSLEEVAPGVFRASVRVARGGRFDVPMLIDQPRITHCFRLVRQRARGGGKAAPPLAAEVAIARDDLMRRSVPFRVRLVDRINRQPVSASPMSDSSSSRPRHVAAATVAHGVGEGSTRRARAPACRTFRLCQRRVARNAYWDLPDDARWGNEFRTLLLVLVLLSAVRAAAERLRGGLSANVIPDTAFSIRGRELRSTPTGKGKTVAITSSSPVAPRSAHRSRHLSQRTEVVRNRP